MRRLYSWQLFIFAFCTGCTVGPRYEPPQMEISDEWQTPPSKGMSAAQLDCFLWWESLNDPILNSLLQRAAQQNIDLLIAGSRILEARLMRKGKEAETYPQVDASLTAGHLYWSKDLLKKGILGDCASHHAKRNVSFFEAGFDADWEIDLFGFHRHQVSAAEAKVEAAEASLCDIWVSLSAEIARNYIELRGLQHRRKLVDRHIEGLRDSVHLTQELLTIGIDSEIDAIQAKVLLSQLAAEKPLLDLSIDKTIHRLSVLLGYPPGDLFAELCDAQAIPCLPCEKPIGLPSELLRRRPDIRRAERDLAAATEEVGTAVAALFPRFSIFGFVGEIGTHLRSLTNGNGATWFAAPQLLFPIFNSRLLQQDVKFNQLQARQALFEYQKTVLAALEEVENALAAFRYETERYDQLSRAKSLSREAYQLNRDLYQKGIQDYLTVLTSHRSLLAAEEADLQSEISLLMHYVALYKALGGGWDVAQCCE